MVDFMYPGEKAGPKQLQARNPQIIQPIKVFNDSMNY